MTNASSLSLFLFFVFHSIDESKLLFYLSPHIRFRLVLHMCCFRNVLVYVDARANDIGYYFWVSVYYTSNRHMLHISWLFLVKLYEWKLFSQIHLTQIKYVSRVFKHWSKNHRINESKSTLPKIPKCVVFYLIVTKWIMFTCHHLN